LRKVSILSVESPPDEELPDEELPDEELPADELPDDELPVPGCFESNPVVRDAVFSEEGSS
jgi:hypothetical protein